MITATGQTKLLPGLGNHAVQRMMIPQSLKGEPRSINLIDASKYLVCVVYISLIEISNIIISGIPSMVYLLGR